MILLRIKETPLVRIIGISTISKPYSTHKPNPIINMERNKGDISSTCLVFSAFTICGMMAMVVNTPANAPITLTVVEGSFIS